MPGYDAAAIQQQLESRASTKEEKLALCRGKVAEFQQINLRIRRIQANNTQLTPEQEALLSTLHTKANALRQEILTLNHEFEVLLRASERQYQEINANVEAVEGALARKLSEKKYLEKQLRDARGKLQAPSA